MSDDEDDQAESNANLYEGSLDGGDSLSFGPLVPTESERSLMERVRQELKHELKQVAHYNFLIYMQCNAMQPWCIYFILYIRDMHVSLQR